VATPTEGTLPPTAPTANPDTRQTASPAADLSPLNSTSTGNSGQKSKRLSGEEKTVIIIFFVLAPTFVAAAAALGFPDVYALFDEINRVAAFRRPQIQRAAAPGGQTSHDHDLGDIEV
jgi:hypothetical protein